MIAVYDLTGWLDAVPNLINANLGYIIGVAGTLIALLVGWRVLTGLLSPYGSDRSTDRADWYQGDYPHGP